MNIPVQLNAPAAARRTATNTEKAKESTISKENTSWVRVTWFFPLYSALRICDPPRSIVLTAPINILIGANSPTALIASCPMKFDANRLVTMPLSAPIAASRIWIGSSRKHSFAVTIECEIVCFIAKIPSLKIHLNLIIHPAALF